MVEDYGSKRFVPRCVTIRSDQDDFLQDQRKSFKLSKFVQAKLDEYIEELKKLRNTEVKDEKEI
jgi:hypothetical protein